MERIKTWLLSGEEPNTALTSSLFGELGMLLAYFGVVIYNLIKGKDNRSLFIVLSGFWAGRGIGNYIETKDKKSLLSAALYLCSGSLYVASYILDIMKEE